jgi:hypothetical protein
VNFAKHALADHTGQTAPVMQMTQVVWLAMPVLTDHTDLTVPPVMKMNRVARIALPVLAENSGLTQQTVMQMN